MTDHATALATAREDIERAIIEARLHDDPAGPILHALGSVLTALEPLALAVAQPRASEPGSGARADPRNQQGDHPGDLAPARHPRPRYPFRDLARWPRSRAGALFGDRLCARQAVVTRVDGKAPGTPSRWHPRLPQHPSACSPVNRCAVLRCAPALRVTGCARSGVLFAGDGTKNRLFRLRTKNLAEGKTGGGCLPMGLAEELEPPEGQ